MKTYAYALFALVIAAVMVSTGAAWTVMGAGTSRAWDRDQNANHDQNDTHGHNETDNDQGESHDNETNDNETHENETFVLDIAGGGGWFTAKSVRNVSFKDTFGMFLDGMPGHFNNSSLVFHAREIDVTVHAMVFNTVTFDNSTVPGHHTAHATGTAVGGGLVWTFRLQVTDMGKGMSDLFFLSVTNGTSTVTWQTTGLGGGNIWVEPLVDMDAMEEQGDQV